MRAEDHSNFCAAKAVAEAEAYLRDALTREGLAKAADGLMRDLFMLPGAGDQVSAPTRLLVVAMLRTSAADGAREQRWRDVMQALCGLVRHECRALVGGDT